jgi:tRNA (guanosine-2'-O-)-methyltransferase
LTEKRLKRFKNIVENRQKFLTIVLENIHDPHNVSAIFRTADSAGIDKIHLIYNTNKFPKISNISSASAKKWIELVRFDSVKECFKNLRKEKYKIYSTHLSESEKNYSLYELDLTNRVALVFGNEHLGVSEEVKLLSDKNFLIPMYGMVKSLNVSVSAAICLYEALRQRSGKGMYDKSAYTKKELMVKLEDYIKK